MQVSTPLMLAISDVPAFQAVVPMSPERADLLAEEVDEESCWGRERTGSRTRLVGNRVDEVPQVRQFQGP